MSIKIYTAYRTKPGVELFPLVRYLRLRGEQEASKAIEQLYEVVIGGLSPDNEDYRDYVTRYGDCRMAQITTAQKIVRTKYREQASSPHRNEYNLDVSIVIREHEGRYCLIPFCDLTMNRTLDFLAEDPRLESFGYWNNVPKPDDVTDEEWTERRAAWDALDSNGHWSDMLVLEICALDKYYQVDPYHRMMEAAKTARCAAKATADGAGQVESVNTFYTPGGEPPPGWPKAEGSDNG